MIAAVKLFKEKEKKKCSERAVFAEAFLSPLTVEKEDFFFPHIRNPEQSRRAGGAANSRERTRAVHACHPSFFSFTKSKKVLNSRLSLFFFEGDNDVEKRNTVFGVRHFDTAQHTTLITRRKDSFT